VSGSAYRAMHSHTGSRGAVFLCRWRVAGNPISISVPDLAAVLEDYDRIRLYSATSQTGSYTLLTTLTLVPGTSQYAYDDAAGAATSWYRYSFFHSVSLAESVLSDPQPAGGTATYDRQYLRRQIAHRLSCYGYPRTNYTHPGVSGTTTAAGDTDTVVASAFISTRLPARWYEGWFCLLNSGSASGQEREVSAYDPSVGEFTVSPVYGAASGSGTTFDLYAEAPSSWWNERLDDARRNLWLPFRFPIAGVIGQREYALPDYINREGQILRLVRQSGDTIRDHTYAPGSAFEVIEGDGGGVSLYFHHGLPENSVWYLEGRSHPGEFLSDTSTIPLSDEMLDYYITASCQSACQVLADALFGNTEDRRIWGDKAARFELERRGKAKDLNLWSETRPARRRPMVALSGGRYDMSAY